MSQWFPKRVRWLAVIPAILLGSMVEFKAGHAYCRSEFRKYFEGLAATGASVNPVQRVFFSLVLANAKSHAQAAVRPATSARHL